MAARVSYLDLDDEDVLGGRELNASLGVNWYLAAHVQMKANYILAWFPDGHGVANIFQIRVQLDY